MGLIIKQKKSNNNEDSINIVQHHIKTFNFNVRKCINSVEKLHYSSLFSYKY